MRGLPLQSASELLMAPGGTGGHECGPSLFELLGAGDQPCKGALASKRLQFMKEYEVRLSFWFRECNYIFLYTYLSPANALPLTTKSISFVASYCPLQKVNRRVLVMVGKASLRSIPQLRGFGSPV